MPKLKRVALVRYCPGSASGSPAWLPPDEAERYLVRHSDLTDILRRLDPALNLTYPHIGGSCEICRPRQQELRLS
jgi:hypothetical protein